MASVINPAHWTQDIRREHTCRGVQSSPSSLACCSFCFHYWDRRGNHFVLHAAVSLAASEITSLNFNPKENVSRFFHMKNGNLPVSYSVSLSLFNFEVTLPFKFDMFLNFDFPHCHLFANVFFFRFSLHSESFTFIAHYNFLCE